MPGMKMPEWYNEALEQMGGVLSQPPPPMNPPPALDKITSFPYLFAEYAFKERDVLVHLFPRAGMDDLWTDGHYLNICRNCRSEVPIPKDNDKVVRKCPRCKNTGLVYVPGRSEAPTEEAFPTNMRDLVKQAADTMWMGDIAVELVPELRAYVVQFQKAKNTAAVVGIEKFVGQMCEKLNALLTPPN